LTLLTDTPLLKTIGVTKVCQVNTAQNSTLSHSRLLNKQAKFSSEILSHF